MAGRVIAIDGPAASGKSSVARKVAEALGFGFVSSGLFYRALAWGSLRDQVDQVRDIASRDVVAGWVGGRRLELRNSPGGPRLLLDDEDVTPRLSDPEVAARVSQVAAFPSVRDLVNENLRLLARARDLVVEGRDIGSVVFPETPYKFYLDASPEERARRRAREGVVDSVTKRDRLDSTRSTAPLIIPWGSRLIDTTRLTLDQVVGTVLEHLHQLGSFPTSS